MSSGPDADGTDDAGSSVLQTIVPNVIRRSFALKFALVLIVMGVIVVAIGFTATETLSTEVEDDVETEYQRLAGQQASLVEKWIERNAVSTRLASQNQDLIIDASKNFQLNDALSRTWGTLYGAHHIHLVTKSDSGMQIVATTGAIRDTPKAPSDVGRGSWTDIEMAMMNPNDVTMTDVYTVSSTQVVGFVSPVTGSSNRYVVIEFRVDELAGSMKNTGLESTGSTDHFTQVVNADGTVQVASGDDEINSAYGDSQTIQEALQLGEGSDGPTADVAIQSANPTVMNQQYAVGYAPVSVDGVSENWVVATHAPTSDLFGFVQRMTTWGRIATLASMVLIGVIGASMGYSTASAIDRLSKKADEIEQGNLDVEIHSNRIDSIGRLYDSFGNMRDALRTQIREAEQARKEAEVSRAEATEMNRYLEEKAEQYSQTMEQCAAGDLTQRMDADGESDAMDRIAAEFNDMIDELEKTTGQLKRFADEVETAGDVVQQSSESVQDAAEQVADSIQRISDDAYEQKDRLQAVSEEMDVLADQLEAFAADHPDVDFADQLDQINSVSTTISEVVELAEQTMAESENVAGAAEEQAAELNEVSQRAADLIRYARPLDDVLNRFETQSEHEFYFPTGPGSTDPTSTDSTDTD